MKTEHIDRAAVDVRYAEKMRARIAGTAPVFVTAPAVDPNALDAASVEARYRAKMAARRAATAPGIAQRDAGFFAPATDTSSESSESSQSEEPKPDRPPVGLPRRGR